MVHVDRTDDGSVGVQHVRGVPSPAHTDLDDGHVHRGVGERPDRHRREHFEEAHARAAVLDAVGVHQCDEILDLVIDVDEIILAQLLAVDGDAFGDGFKVRRRVQAGAQAIGAAQRLRHACRAALAVRAGDVDDAE